MKHINVALFVPDEGCLHRCSFCNQKTISGFKKKLTSFDVDSAVETALRSKQDASNAEIAFFGGSFTAIDRDYMTELLSAAHKYIAGGYFKGIRISTRPDCINKEILDILKKYSVTSIELGCQSMDDEVLFLNNRGHNSEAVVNACELIKAYDFELGVQMMTGLYGDTDQKAIESAKKLIALKPQTARIYPTIVLENTELAELYMLGKYKAQTLEQAVNLCSKLLMMFNEAGINVIRLGLHSGGNVEEGYLAGAFHPAFRELCESRIYFERTLNQLENKPAGEYTVEVASKNVSQFVGQKRSNITRFDKMGYKIKPKTNDSLKKYEIIVQGRTR